MNVADGAATLRDDRSVSSRAALLSCIPGLLALLTFVAHQYQDVPPVVRYFFWPLLLTGVVTGVACLVRFRRVYRARRRPWVISLSIVVHCLVVLVGVPFLLLLVVGALT